MRSGAQSPMEQRSSQSRRVTRTSFYRAFRLTVWFGSDPVTRSSIAGRGTRRSAFRPKSGPSTRNSICLTAG